LFILVVADRLVGSYHTFLLN